MEGKGVGAFMGGHSKGVWCCRWVLGGEGRGCSVAVLVTGARGASICNGGMIGTVVGLGYCRKVLGCCNSCYRMASRFRPIWHARYTQFFSLILTISGCKNANKQDCVLHLQKYRGAFVRTREHFPLPFCCCISYKLAIIIPGHNHDPTTTTSKLLLLRCQALGKSGLSLQFLVTSVLQIKTYNTVLYNSPLCLYRLYPRRQPIPISEKKDFGRAKYYDIVLSNTGYFNFKEYSIFGEEWSFFYYNAK